jgi:hypothetical protein
VGAGLSIFNLLRAHLTDSERGTLAVIGGNDQEHPGVEVVNRSPFPITITELGSVHLDGQVAGLGLNNRFAEVDRLPKRIESRHSHTFHIDMHETIARVVHRPMYTYARTALGTIFTSEPKQVHCWRRVLEAVRLRARAL